MIFSKCEVLRILIIIHYIIQAENKSLIFLLDFFIKLWYNITISPYGQAVKTPPSHGGIGGSIPPRDTNLIEENE